VQAFVANSNAVTPCPVAKEREERPERFPECRRRYTCDSP